MRISTSMRWLVVAVSAAMLLAVAGACGTETVEVPGETVVVEKVVTETVEVPGETVVVEKEVIRTVEVPGETVTKEVVKEVMVPGETVVVEKVVTETVEVPGETVTVEVVKEVQVPGETVVVEKVVTQTVQVPGETVVVEKEVVKTVEVPGQTVVVEKEVVKTVAGPERIVEVEAEVASRYTTNALGKVVEAPQYGGIITGVVDEMPDMGPDPINPRQNWVTHWIHEVLATLDWAKGPAGTGEWWGSGGWYDFDTTAGLTSGRLAESWEQPDPETTIFHIRKGVYFHDRPPVNGREMTAADVAYSYSRYLGLGYAGFEEGLMQRGVTLYKEALISVEVPDKYTVVFKHIPSALLMDRFEFAGAGEPVDLVTAQEAVEQEGGYNEYMKLVGTGPFIIDEFVLDSAINFVKNPNYWGYDALHPENRLPYVDGIDCIVVPDESTQLALLRAGKNMVYFTGDWQVVDQLAETHPDLVKSQIKIGGSSLFMSNDSPPFDDIRVRRALQMSVDIDEYVETYWGGHADPVLYPIFANDGYYTPFDELPQEVQDSYTYNPVRAKDLLIEAGYGEGNPLKFTMYHTGGPVFERFIIARDYFEALGVPMDVDLTFVEPAVYFDMILNEDKTLFSGIAYESSGVITPITYAPYLLDGFTSGGRPSPSHVNDPHYDAMYERLLEVEAGSDEWHALIKELNDYSFTQNWFIAMPNTFITSLSQPWLHNYTGGWGITWTFVDAALAHLWIDQDLKRELGH